MSFLLYLQICVMNKNVCPDQHGIKSYLHVHVCACMCMYVHVCCLQPEDIIYKKTSQLLMIGKYVLKDYVHQHRYYHGTF